MFLLKHESLDIPDLAVGEPTARDDDVDAIQEKPFDFPKLLERIETQLRPK